MYLLVFAFGASDRANSRTTKAAHGSGQALERGPICWACENAGQLCSESSTFRAIFAGLGLRAGGKRPGNKKLATLWVRARRSRCQSSPDQPDLAAQAGRPADPSAGTGGWLELGSWCPEWPEAARYAPAQGCSSTV